MPYFCGVDIGAAAAKLVVIDERGRMVANSLRRSGVDYADAAERCLAEALAAAGLERGQLAASVSTGYGRDNVPWADAKRTEIACHGQGAWFHFRRRMTVIDIGAQDSKVIHLDDGGCRTGFKMNRKCAAGTGAFLDEIAHRLGQDPAWFDDLARRSTKDVEIGSYCTVFTASEILTMIRRNLDLADIIKGIFSSVIQRIMEMDLLEGEVVMSGGVVAHHPYLVEMFAARLGRRIHLPPHPQLTGALGAALYAAELPEAGRA